MNRFDPRGKVNRALVVGVSRYDHTDVEKGGVSGQLKAVEHNRSELCDVLRRSGMFGSDDDVLVCDSPFLDGFDVALHKVAQEAEGLLLLYFAGHGIVRVGGNDLHLQMRNARIVYSGKGSFPGSASFESVLAELDQSRAERVVVILDCCYSGNARHTLDGLRDDHKVMLLMSAQAHRLITPGDHSEATPFTRELIEVLGERDELSLSQVYERLRARMRAAAVPTHYREGETQEPQAQWDPGVDVLLRGHGRAADEPDASAGTSNPVSSPEPEELPPHWLKRLAPLLHRAGGLVLTLALTAVATVAGGFGIGVLAGDGNGVCAPPLHLRVLTDADLEPVIAAAANAYTESPENLRDGCRRSGIGVYSAGATDVVTGLREQAGKWRRPTGRDGEPQPQRDIGPQPDVWIPGSRADLDRARPDPIGDDPVVQLHADSGPFAYSPVVLAASYDAPWQRTGRSLVRMATDLASGGLTVRRPDPEYTDSALFATMGLYGETDDTRGGERRVAHQGPPARDAAELLCAASGGPPSAVLVPEFALTGNTDCPWGGWESRTALYPDDVPGLTPTFVRVRWLAAVRDAPARQTEIERFRDWLTGDEGRKILGGEGLRSADAGHRFLGVTPHGAEAGLADSGRYTEATAMNATLGRYRNALGPGQVLFLLDSSGSMDRLWRGPSSGPGLIQQSLGGLGGKDRYGVWAVAGRTGPTHTDLLPFGPHARADAVRALEAARKAGARGAEADPYQALRDALEFMKRQGVDTQQPQMVVYLTDDEDNDRLTGQNLADLKALARDSGVPVTMVSLATGGCEPDRADRVISGASQGRCLDPGHDLAADLRDEVARTGTGTGEK
ncbi:caspase family protein [Streptomyces sp. S6]